MKKNFNIILIFLSVMLMGAVALLLEYKCFATNVPFYFEAKTAAGTETIHIWQRDDGEGFVFLPSYINLADLQFQSDSSLWFDDYELTQGMTCENLELGKPYTLSGSVENPSAVTFVQSQNIPALYINTASGSMDHIHKEKGNTETGMLRLYTSDGALDYSGKVSALKLRGNNIEEMKKFHYSLKLSADGDLLGMGRAKKWILLSDEFDSTYLRNKIIYDAAARMNLPYSPESQWVDLYLNGEYVGLYLLCERNEVHPRRVNLSQQGSFLVSLEMEPRLIEQKLPYVKTNAGAPLRIRYGGMGEDAIAQIFQSVENSIFSEDGYDPRTGKHWTELIDLDSWARKYLLEEIFANVDGGRVSQYFYLDGSDPDGKIYAGPVWDYDMALANPQLYAQLADEVYEISPNVFYVNAPPENWGSFWFYPLCRNEQFREYMTDLYQTEFLPLLSDLINHDIEAYARQIAQAAHMDKLRWNTQNTREQADNLRSYLEKRVEFLNKVWLENQEYITVAATCAWREMNFILKPGDFLPDLPVAEGRNWYYKGTEELVDLTQPIYEDMNIVFMSAADFALTEEIAQTEAATEEAPKFAINVPIRRVAPILLFAAFFLSLILADYLRTKRSDPKQDAKRNKIPS